MYYNIITKEITKHPYRFKTEKEFEDEYGGNWMDNIEWPTSMDKYFGIDFLKDYEDDHTGTGYYLKDGDWYRCISRDMLTKNKSGLDYNKPAKLVYEKRILSFKKFNDR